jgi:TonB-linked SusC/RagA family outer membrane protein
MKKRFFLRTGILLLLFMTTWSSIAQIKVTGTVKDDLSLIFGVTVIERGTNNGVLTDFDGNFIITVKSEKSVLQLSYIGMKTISQVVGQQTSFNFTMEEDAAQLDEIVVVGYGTQKKSDLTGSVSSVKTSQLQTQSASNVSDLLQGRVAGLQMVKSSDNPNAASEVRIRGASSLFGTNEPLVVIDGFPFGNDLSGLKQINPANIESMEILKDASSAAIYGSQGANGVILITTKSGKIGKSKIYVRSQISVGSFTSEFDRWKDPVLMAQLSNESKVNGGFLPLYVGEPFLGVYYPSIQELETGEYPYFTDWTDVVFRDMKITTNLTVGANGGNEDSRYNIALNYWDEEGQYKENNYDRLNVVASLNQKITNKLSARVNTNVTFTNTQRDTGRGVYGNTFNRNPLFPIYNNGNPDDGFFRTNDMDFDNPVERRAAGFVDKGETLDLILNAALTYNITPHFKLQSTVSYKHGATTNDSYTPMDFNASFDGIAAIYNYKDNSFSSENFLTYTNDFGKHNISAMVGWTYQKNTNRTSYLEGRDFISDALTNQALELSAVDNRVIRNSAFETGLESVYTRWTYNYDGKYLLNLTARADGSTKFGANNKWGYFPSIGAGWNVHKEDFFGDNQTWNTFKIRTSFGVTGNQGVSPYQTLTRYGSDVFYNGTDWVTTIGPGTIGTSGRFTTFVGIPSKDLKWESTSQLNIGFETQFFNNKLRFEFDYYIKRTTDLIRNKILAPSTAFDFLPVNDGEIENKGLEMTLEYRNLINSGNFKLTPLLTLSGNKNKVIDIGTAVDSGLIEDLYGNIYLPNRNDVFFAQLANVYAIGQPARSFYGYRTDGLIQNAEDAAGHLGPRGIIGRVKYVDLSGDGKIGPEDRTIIGNPNPDFFGSLNLAFQYKKWDASVFFDGVYGNEIFDMQKYTRTEAISKRWTPDNPNNEYRRHIDISGGDLVSDHYVADGSYLRLQNISLGYTTEIRKIANTKLRLYLNVDNIYTWTKYAGYSPEVGLEGLDFGGIPRTSTTTLGLDITF